MVNKENIKNLLKDTISYIDNSKLNIIESYNKYLDDSMDNGNTYKENIDLVKKELNKDLSFFMDSDPAADTIEEVKISYPGYKAIMYYRIAHVLRKMGFNVESRIITESAHSKTGIDIHPGATIDSPFFIDHGTGIVIGETTIIGKNVKMYQGVTLGAVSLSKGSLLKGVKRHPTIKNNVTIYAGASILGDITIGNNVTIGSNVFLIEAVPDNTLVTIGKPILNIKEK